MERINANEKGIFNRIRSQFNNWLRDCCSIPDRNIPVLWYSNKSKPRLAHRCMVHHGIPGQKLYIKAFLQSEDHLAIEIEAIKRLSTHLTLFEDFSITIPMDIQGYCVRIAFTKKFSVRHTYLSKSTLILWVGRGPAIIPDMIDRSFNRHVLHNP